MKRLTSLLAASMLTLSFAACHNADTDKSTSAVVDAHETTIDSMKMEIVKQRVVDSMEDVARAEEKEAVVTTVVAAPARRKTPRRSSSSNASSSSQYNSNSSYSNAAYEPAPVAPVKRGWSAKAKGAIIGAGAGAVGGAIINKKNRGAGAVIGGLGGAAVGTGVGAILDHRNGR